jgi:hypothetical protein
MELGANNLNTGDLGIIMTRHGETGNVAIVYDESQDVLNVGYTLSNAYENTITMDTANSLTLQVNNALNVGSNVVMDDVASNVIEVSGNVKTDSLFLGNFEVVASQGLSHVTAVSAATNDTVYLNNPTTGLVVDSNAEVGGNLSVEGDLEFNGNLTMNTITVQTLFTLDHVVSQGNTTANTVQFTNPTTALTATGNVEVGGELSVSGDVEVGGELSVSANVEVGTANLFVDTLTGNVGVGTTEPRASLDINSTGAMIVPVGTTAQQPTGIAGMIRFNTTLSKLQVYDGTNWFTIGAVNASGGTVTYADGYTIHTFTSSDNFTVYSGGVVEYLVVAGGGGGATQADSNNRGGGGGGAGGVLTGSTLVSGGTYTITVGDGGDRASTPYYSVGTDGNDSSFNTYTAIGGGRGGTGNGAEPNTGGSGGGGGSGSYPGTGANGTSGQGNAGGNGVSNSGGASGGGGGGAGGFGGNAVSGVGAVQVGGIGLASDISGSTVTYAVGGASCATGGSIPLADRTRLSNTGDGGYAGAGQTTNSINRPSPGSDGIVILRYLT